ncbi:helix-turn-helix transcriptional regulator [Paraburkholderia sp. MM5477-R1]|uniref:helix-turn-helix transcriptional regulator n=1 Tax=Paraburkholderia sp. MM5477-R1 TaxID=2991062 RepID=UPI003D23ACEE
MYVFVRLHTSSCIAPLQIGRFAFLQSFANDGSQRRKSGLVELTAEGEVMKEAKAESLLIRLMRAAEVEMVCGVKHTAMYRMIGEGTFPAPVRLPNSRAVRWRSTDIFAWLESLEIYASGQKASNAESVVQDRPDEVGAQRGKRGRPAKRIAEAV